MTPRLSPPGHRSMIAPMVCHKPFTDAAKRNHERRLRIMLERIQS